MSSKKRRAAREWMHKQAEKQKLELLNAQRERERAVKDERDRLTAMIAPDDDGTSTPLGRPEYTTYRIAALAGLDARRIFNPHDLRYYPRVPIYMFRVKQHAHVLPCGLKVIWYGLEFCG